MKNRQENESYIRYCQRMTNCLDNKEISYTEWAKNVLGSVPYGEENLRRISNVLKIFLNNLTEENIDNVSDEELLLLLKEEKNQIIKERKKLQTENLQYAENKRFESRNELFYEKIIDYNRLKLSILKVLIQMSNQVDFCVCMIYMLVLLMKSKGFIMKL